MPSTSPPASVTFATGIESGPMEAMTLRLVESLRCWGGRFANCPFIAIQPRAGAPIRTSTVDALQKLGVTFKRVTPPHDLSWYVWANKPTTLLAAEEIATTESIAWLDADMLVLAEPTALELSDQFDFAASAADKNAGTTGPEDQFDIYWRELCQRTGLDYESLPWVTTEREKARIKLYFNAGMFSYRRSTQFATHFMKALTQSVSAKIKSTTQGIWMTEQITLGLTVHRMGLRYDALPIEYNFAIGSKLQNAKLYDPARIRNVKILHYHDALWPSFRPTFLEQLKSTRPDVQEWIAATAPLSADLPMHHRLYNKSLGYLRKRRYDKHQAESVAF